LYNYNIVLIMWESAFVLGLTIKPKLYQLIVTKRCDLLD